MYKIKSKNEILHYKPEENEILVRVSSHLPYGKENGFKKIYSFGFEDLPYESHYSISDEEAKDIVNIFLENKDKDFVFQCDYAQGRSPAMALAFNFIVLNINNKEIRDKYPDLNYFVYDKIVEQYQKGEKK